LKKKFFITTTVPASLNFFKDNLAFLNEEFEVCAISSQKNELDSIGLREGVRTYHIPMKRPISLWRDIFCFIKFIYLFVKEQPDIVHGNTPKASLLSMVAAKITGVKVRIYMCHGLRYQGTQGKLRWLLMKMEKITCFCASEVICVSHGVKDTLVKDGLCSSGKAVVIHYGSASGINLNHFKIENKEIKRGEIRDTLGIKNDDFVFLFIGRLVKDKGIDELVASFTELNKTHRSTHLILVGTDDGKMNPVSLSTKDQIETNNNIHAVGRIADVRPYLLASDTFVLPSYREGFGIVLMEAGAMGVPCITTDIIGCNEIIIQGENGEIIPPRDEKALYEKMKEWVESPQKIAYMAKNARPLIEERYDQKLVWNALLEEYKRLTNELYEK
jgi:glycosyltransferase involved in cell wall biosynthesis